MIFFAAAFVLSFRDPPPLNLYDMVSGNWSRRVNNVTTFYPVTLVSSVIEDGANLTTFTCEYDSTPIEIIVTSNSTAKLKFGDLTGDLSMISESKGIAYGESHLSDGTHITISSWANQAFEIAIVPKDASDVLTMGFHKVLDSDYSWKDFVIPGAIALVLTYLIRNVLPNFF